MARVLVVDDRAANRDLLSYLLDYYGYDVFTAPDGAAAVRAAEAQRPDLVVMDIAMPGVDGYAAARLMRATPTLGQIPLIAVSATSSANLVDAQAAGFDAFYPLPIDPEDFVSALREFLTQPGDLPTSDGTQP